MYTDKSLEAAISFEKNARPLLQIEGIWGGGGDIRVN